MAGGVTFKAKTKVGRDGKLFKPIQERLRKPMQGGGAQTVASAMRHGPGSVKEQFQSTSYSGVRGRKRWKKTEDFGRRSAPPRTLNRSGSLQRAWTGEGPGSETRFTRNKVQIGVDHSRFPHAARFQSLVPTFTRPKPGAKTRGRYKMGWFLGMQFGIWLSDKRLEQGLKVEPRRVGVNRRMMRNVASAMRTFLLTGKAVRRGRLP